MGIKSLEKSFYHMKYHFYIHFYRKVLLIDHGNRANTVLVFGASLGAKKAISSFPFAVISCQSDWITLLRSRRTTVIDKIAKSQGTTGSALLSEADFIIVIIGHWHSWHSSTFGAQETETQWNGPVRAGGD